MSLPTTLSEFEMRDAKAHFPGGDLHVGSYVWTNSHQIRHCKYL